MKYFDVHAHIFPENIAGKVIEALETYYGYPWQGTGMLDDLLASMDQAHINRCVIFSSATKPAQVEHINDYISSIQKQYPDRFVGFGTLHPDYPDRVSEIKRVKQLGLRGFKFHPDFQRFFVDSPEMMRIYEAIGDNMPVLFHIGDRKTDFSSPRRLAHVIETFPNLKVIAAHMGGYTEWDEARKHLIGKNVMLDISSTQPLISRDEVRDMVLAHGVDKVFFASDYPAVHHTRAVEDVLSLGLTPEQNEAIFYKNAEKLFGITL